MGAVWLGCSFAFAALGLVGPAEADNPAGRPDGATITFLEENSGAAAEGDPFSGERWSTPGAEGKAWVQSKFSRPVAVTSIETDQAGFGPPGSKGSIRVELLGLDGQSWPLAEFVDRQIGSASEDESSSGPRTIVCASSANATGLRYRFSGPGPFSLAKVEVRFREVKTASAAVSGTATGSDNPAALAQGATLVYLKQGAGQGRTPNPFAGGLWSAEGVGGQAWIQSKFSRPIQVTSIRTERARFGPPGAEGKIRIELLGVDGQFTEAGQFENRQIGEERSLGPQVVDCDPPVRALGVRYRLSGPGPFELAKVHLRFERGQSPAAPAAEPTPRPTATRLPTSTPRPTPAPDPEVVREANMMVMAQGRWLLATSSGLRQDASMVLRVGKDGLYGYWDFALIEGGAINARWTGQNFEAEAEFGRGEIYDLSFTLSEDGQRMECQAARRLGGVALQLFYVKQPTGTSRTLDENIRAYLSEWDRMLDASGPPGPAPGAVDFSGVWVQSADADDTDLRHLALRQEGYRVWGEFRSPEGLGTFQGVVRGSRLYAKGVEPSGAKKCYRIRLYQVEDSPDQLRGYAADFDGPIPLTPYIDWRRERAPF